MQTLIFYTLSALAVGLAVNMIMAKKAVTSAISLVGVMFCLAALFALLEAHLIAALQVLVYAGAIMVLFLFVIMLLNLREKEGALARHTAVAQLVAVAILAALLLPFMSLASMGGPGPLSEGFGATAEVGKLLYTEYLLPFEIASVMLLAGLVGAVMLTKLKLK